ncbi:MAG: tyrosine-type recombinase/integrase [Gemmataceae bacterium]
MLAPRVRRKRIINSDGKPKTIDVERTLGQRTINQRIQRVIRMFKWATEEEIIPLGINIAASLAAVPLLRNGRFGVKPPRRIQPARQEDLDKVLPHLTPQTRAMVELIALTGMRSSDACGMRPIDIDRSGDVWKYRPRKFKRSAIDGQKPRTIYLGARAQVIIHPFLKGRAPEANLFSPAESMANLRAMQKRRPCSKERVKNPKRLPGESYDSQALYHAVRAAAEKAGIGEFFPNQLRHMAATRFRSLFGIEDAKILMGHGSIATTEIYAEQDSMRSIRIVREIG